MIVLLFISIYRIIALVISVLFTLLRNGGLRVASKGKRRRVEVDPNTSAWARAANCASDGPQHAVKAEAQILESKESRGAIH